MRCAPWHLSALCYVLCAGEGGAWDAGRYDTTGPLDSLPSLQHILDPPTTSAYEVQGNLVAAPTSAF